MTVRQKKNIVADGFFLGNGRGMARFLEALLEPVAPEARKVWRPRGILSWMKRKQFHPLWEQLVLPLKATLRARHNDVLLNGFNTAPLWLPKRMQSVQIVHDAIFMASEAELPFTGHWLKDMPRHYRRFIVPRTVRRATHVVTVSTYSRDAICREFKLDPARVHVLYNSVSDAVFARAPLPREMRQNYLFTVSGDTPSKNLSAAFSVLARLATTDDGNSCWRLKVAGVSPGAHSRLLGESDALGLAGRVEFLPRLDDEELFAVYRRAAAYLCTSLQEGFGIPLIEAMACGTPVVSTAATALPEVLGGAGLLFAPEELQTAVAHLRRLLNDATTWNDLQNKGLARARIFSNSMVRIQIVEFWRGIGVKTWDGLDEK